MTIRGNRTKGQYILCKNKEIFFYLFIFYLRWQEQPFFWPAHFILYKLIEVYNSLKVLIGSFSVIFVYNGFKETRKRFLQMCQKHPSVGFTCLSLHSCRGSPQVKPG